jgi:hypothetical protein
MTTSPCAESTAEPDLTPWIPIAPGGAAVADEVVRLNKLLGEWISLTLSLDMLIVGAPSVWWGPGRLSRL